MEKEPTNQEIYSVLQDIQKSMATKEEMVEGFAIVSKSFTTLEEKLDKTKEDLTELIKEKESGLLGAVDAHTNKHPADHTSHESRITKLERHLGFEEIIAA